MECNVNELGYLIPEGVKLARRNSGGGTVYHDRGNLNLTFFTPREHYNRKHNLDIIVQAILKEYNLNIEITKRDDLVIGDCKVCTRFIMCLHALQVKILYCLGIGHGSKISKNDCISSLHLISKFQQGSFA